MKIYLQNIISNLKQFSESLNKHNLLINKPWTLIDSDFDIQKLIFKKDKSLILSKDGQATIGKWDYFPEARSLLIDRGTDKILCNETYIDDSILVLKMDGKNNKFFILANQNAIPSLDAYAYLRKLYCYHFGVNIKLLTDNRYLQINPTSDNTFGVGSFVIVDGVSAPDGEYVIKGNRQKVYVFKNTIVAVKYLKNYILKNGDNLIIEQDNKNSFQVGNIVALQHRTIQDGVYILRNGDKKLHVVGRKITHIFYVREYRVANSTQVLTIDQYAEDVYSKRDTVWIDGKKAKDGKYKLDQFPNIMVQSGVIKKTGMSFGGQFLLGLIIFIILTASAVMLFSISVH